MEIKRIFLIQGDSTSNNPSGLETSSFMASQYYSAKSVGYKHRDSCNITESELRADQGKLKRLNQTEETTAKRSISPI